MRTHLFSYWFEGSRYSMEVVAESREEAQRRVHQMRTAEYDGEVMAKLPLAPRAPFWRRLFKA